MLSPPLQLCKLVTVNGKALHCAATRENDAAACVYTIIFKRFWDDLIEIIAQFQAWYEIWSLAAAQKS